MSGPVHAAEGVHATRRDYLTGFILAALLTIAPFALVMRPGAIGPVATGAIVMGLAAVQVVVHMIYFLHMNRRSEGGWTLLALLFTLLLVGIVLSGSMWVMSHLQNNMMPIPMDEMR
jgi:cytochrome o ubiquinol oxidase operon protein cyoD